MGFGVVYRNCILRISQILNNFNINIKSVVRLAGIEPTTLGFGGQYSIH
jgi:hypothetical protein